MDSVELKFLLKLLGCQNYRSPIAASTFSSFKGKEKLCQNLGDRNLIDYSRETATVKILPPGRALLKTDTSQIPISEKELKVLEAIAKSSAKIKPSEIKAAKAAEKEEILPKLAERGLIETDIKMKRQKAEVWLTQRGQEFLRDEFTAKGTSAVLSLDLLTNYLRFLRKSLGVKPDLVSPSVAIATNKPTDDDILQIIRDLDRELGTENYLPIFHLRQKLQPPLSREELDRALYHLQRNDLIELSSLVDTTPYTFEQIDAGITQDIGGPLFFIVVN
ncbi:MAG TPA: hypothetical protein V6D28_29705 [Leptolyngbyaceae cyanobacterium]